MRSRLRRRDDRGAIIILTSILALSLLTFTAFAVDIGHESEVRRHLHAVADIAAEDGLYGLGTSSALANVTKIAVASASANGHPMTGTNQLTVEIGQWSGSTPSFQPIPCAASPAPCPSPPCLVTISAANDPPVIPSCIGKQDGANAIRVTASNAVIWNFVSGSQGLSALAVATPDIFTGLEVGTFDAGASVTASQAAFLSSALGVSGVSYDGLGGANMNINDLSSALGFASPNDMLNGTGQGPKTFKQLTDASVVALTKDGNSAAAAKMAGISSALTGTTTGNSTVNFGSLFGSSTGTGGSSALFGNGQVDALGLLTAAYDASVINGTTFASLNGLSIGVAGVSVDSGVKVVQGPGWGFGGSCGTTTTEPSLSAPCAQAHAAQLEGQVIVHLPEIDVPVGLGQAKVSANIPLYFDNAGAHAWVSSYCPSFTGHQADVDAWGHTGISHLAFGQNTAINAATNKEDFSNSGGGSIGIQGPNGANVAVNAVTFIEVTIPSVGVDVSVSSNGTVSVLDSGVTHLQPTGAAGPPAAPVASYSGAFQPPTAGTPPVASGSPGYRGPDRMAATQYQNGQTVNTAPVGQALAGALTALGNALPDPSVQVNARLALTALGATVQTSIDAALATDMSSIRSILGSLDQSYFAPLSATFEAAIAGADVTNLAAQNQVPPNGTVCIPKVVQ